MSEIKLQKIKFPGLNNTYTIPIPEEVTSIEHGGTGATTAEEARNALGAAGLFNAQGNGTTGATYIYLPNFTGSALVSVDSVESYDECGESSVFLIVCPYVKDGATHRDGYGIVTVLGCAGSERNAVFELTRCENGWQFTLDEKYTKVCVMPLCDYDINNVVVSTSSVASGTRTVYSNVYLANKAPMTISDTTYGNQGSND